MGWDYDITADGADLIDYCERVVVVTEGMANREDSDFKLPGLEGEVTFPNKLWDSGNVILVTFLRYTDPDGVITHTDGSAGHIYENISALKAIFGKNGLVDLRRTAPDYGENRMDVELIQGPNEGQWPGHQIWILKAPKPFWRGLTPVVISGSGSVTPAGDAPIDDMVIEFDGNGRVTIDGEWVEIVGSSGANIMVDCGARTILQSAVHRDRWFNPFSDRWLRLHGGQASTVTFAGSVTGLTYFPKWHGAGG